MDPDLTYEWATSLSQQGSHLSPRLDLGITTQSPSLLAASHSFCLYAFPKHHNLAAFQPQTAEQTTQHSSRGSNSLTRLDDAVHRSELPEAQCQDVPVSPITHADNSSSKVRRRLQRK